MIHTTLLHTSRCPCCDHALNRARGTDGMPQPGDVCICAFCTAMLMFEDDLSVRLLTGEDMEEFDADVLAQIQRHRAAVKLSQSRAHRRGNRR